MLTPLQAIRLILDAATNDNLPAAIKALDDYADQRCQVNGSELTGSNLNTYGQQLVNMEEVRKGFPHHQPINEIA